MSEGENANCRLPECAAEIGEGRLSVAIRVGLNLNRAIERVGCSRNEDVRFDATINAGEREREAWLDEDVRSHRAASLLKCKESQRLSEAPAHHLPTRARYELDDIDDMCLIRAEATGGMVEIEETLCAVLKEGRLKLVADGDSERRLAFFGWFAVRLACRSCRANTDSR
jgi:hypothetical protein